MSDNRNTYQEQIDTLFIDFLNRLGCARIVVADEMKHLDEKLSGIASGVYIQLRTDGLVYVGESKNILQRQKQHLANGVELMALAVIPMNEDRIAAREELETRVIVQARQFGLPMANVEKINALTGRFDASVYLTTQAVTQKLVDELGGSGRGARLRLAHKEAGEATWRRIEAFHDNAWSAQVRGVVQHFLTRTVVQGSVLEQQAWGLELSARGAPTKEWVSVVCGILPVLRVGLERTGVTPFLEPLQSIRIKVLLASAYVAEFADTPETVADYVSVLLTNHGVSDTVGVELVREAKPRSLSMLAQTCTDSPASLLLLNRAVKQATYAYCVETAVAGFDVMMHDDRLVAAMILENTAAMLAGGFELSSRSVQSSLIGVMI